MWFSQILGAKPEWKNPSAEVRLAAVEKLTDPKILKKIATSDNDERVALASLARLTEERDIFEVLSAARSLVVKAAAFQKLSSETLLGEVAIQFAYEPFGKTALEKLTENQDELWNIANSAADPDCQLAAVMKITNQAYLMKIALFGGDDLQPNSRIVDNSVNLQQAKSRRDELRASRGIQLAALEKIFDTSTILEIALHQGDGRIRRPALRRLDVHTVREIIQGTEEAAKRLGFSLDDMIPSVADPSRVKQVLSVYNLNRDARVVLRELETSAPAAAPSPTSASGREVTFVLPCPLCGYNTVVRVRIDWEGHILSGSGDQHEFKCEGCKKMFGVSKAALKPYTDQFV